MKSFISTIIFVKPKNKKELIFLSNIIKFRDLWGFGDFRIVNPIQSF